MGASFEEKSVWVQLVSLLVAQGAYFVVAGMMLSSGVRQVVAFMPLFGASIVFMVVVSVVGHVVAAVTGRPEARDERDRLIAWKAESRSSWLVAAGVVCAIGAMLGSVDNVWTANGLLLALFLSAVLKCALQLVYYRRGV